MTKSKSKIRKQTKRKHNPELVETISAARKNKAWFKIAEILSGPRRKRINVNLSELNKGKNIVVAGKILSQGHIDKKMKIVALSFSDKAKEKLKKAGCEILTIIEEIKKNPEMNDLEILKND